MKNILKKNFATVVIISIALLGLSGCTKDPSLNHPPIVKVSNDKIVNIGETVKLHATVSDNNKEETLTYQWRIAAKPKESKLSLTNTTKTDISFKADKQGIYYFDFIAQNGQVSSKAKRVTIQVRSIIGTWTADLTKTKKETKLNEDEMAEVVESLSSNYKFVFLENGKIEGDDESSWTYSKNGNYKLNGSKEIKLVEANELYMINKLKSDKEVKFYYKRALEK